MGPTGGLYPLKNFLASARNRTVIITRPDRSQVNETAEPL
jgi:hypothetical protein